MLSLKNVNKYFNRHKKNEIHVINDTSIDFDNKGLVALLGPSGCGKTTLLNAIGGMDKINSGSIYINGVKMPKRNSYKKDKLRVLNIGYIFQDYNLLDNRTVYDNVALSLKMIGVKNKDTIQKQVNYILEQVGMYRFRNKLAGNLSGGQRQRVGIARALVKNPEVIIADEPTGNLDSKNTIDIMNIIKSISQNKLVILVTHEKDLAYFYASRIISIEDGKIIKDTVNEHENELDYRLDNKIYLKDFKNIDKADYNDHKIDIYTNGDEKLKIDLVINNGVIYIRTKDNSKIEVVDDNSNIELIDDKYKKITKDIYKENTFNLDILDNTKEKIKYSSIYNVFTMLKTGFKRVASYPIMKKILLIGFFLSAMFVVYSMSSIFGVTKVRDEKFVTVNPNYLYIENSNNSIEDYQKIENLDYISYIIPGNSLVSLQVVSNKLWQLQDVYVNINGSLTDINILSEEDLMYGRMPNKKDEIVIDTLAIDSSKISAAGLEMLDLNSTEDYVGLQLKTDDHIFTIVGLTSKKNPSIYMDKSNFINVIENASINHNDVDNNSKLQSYEQTNDKIEITKGREPLNDYEVIVSEQNRDIFPLNKRIDYKVGETKLLVVGYYKSLKEIDAYYVNNNTYKYASILKNKGISIIPLDKSKTIQELKESGYNIKDTYETSKTEYFNDIKDNILGSLIIAGILLAISFVEIFLMIRASFLSRVKEVGIYRAIGVKKIDIYKMFLGEILIITTIAGLSGVILMSSIMNEITKISYIEGLYAMDYKVITTSLILIYGLNIIIGLLPIRSTIKHTPAEILSRNDVD